MKEPTLEEVLLEVLDSRIANIYTALPGKITKYYGSKQTADVQIQIKDHDIDEEGNPRFRSLPVLPNVPVAFPRGGGCFITFPLAAGDFVFLIFCKTSIDQWRAKGAETSPGDLRQHSLTGAVAVPALYPSGRALGATDGTSVVIGREGGDSDFVAMAGKVLTELQAIKTAFDGHTHVTTATVSTGPVGVIAPPSAMPPPNSVAAEDVKVT